MTVNVRPIDNGVVDGDRSVNVMATAIGHLDASASLSLVDDDIPTLLLTIDLSAIGEADGTASATGTVSRNTDTSGPLRVTLMSDDTTEIAVVQTVTIPANETSVSFSIDAVDDAVVDGNQTATIIASATDHIDGGQAIVVSDNDGGVTGQKWHDLNGDGLKDADEPGLDGWSIVLLDDAGAVVAETSTESVDVNNDGQIDPFTESGLYTLATITGTWNISEVQQQGWHQTTQAADSGTELLYELDQQLDLRFTGNYYEDWGGAAAKSGCRVPMDGTRSLRTAICTSGTGKAGCHFWGS